ncbi:FxsA family protein [Amorphus orientalis]|uniref:UPF0716 protein FxsA n=1 Tax=Amorphus orientalis TaxID=649198 RepID=A0AAE4AR20_9HYPH|nr:FxsA family protein [Amorphus orientalis]MDQ0313722.1 UPF0716 protein FxsA [Amorphus orientalis]
MPAGLLIFIALLAIPATEIAVFVLVGGVIGVLPTIALVFLTAVIGSVLLRHQGLSLLTRIRSEMDAGRVPGSELGHGAMILAAGVLLLTPGFVTDTIGFLLFVPPVREGIWRFIRSRIAVTVVQPEAGRRPTGGRDGPVVDLNEGEYGPANSESPWSQSPDSSRSQDRIDRPKP